MEASFATDINGGMVQTGGPAGGEILTGGERCTRGTGEAGY